MTTMAESCTNGGSVRSDVVRGMQLKVLVMAGTVIVVLWPQEAVLILKIAFYYVMSSG